MSFYHILISFCFLLLAACNNNQSSSIPNESNNDLVSYTIRIGLPKYETKKYVSPAMYKTETYKRFYVEDFENVKTNKYSLVTKALLSEKEMTYYKPEIKYRTISYLEKQRDEESKSVKMPYDIRWDLKTVPARYDTVEVMIVDKDGKYFYDIFPKQFKKYKTGYQTMTRSVVVDKGKPEEKGRFISDVYKDHRLRYTNQIITILREKNFDMLGFLKEKGLDRYDVTVFEK